MFMALPKPSRQTISQIKDIVQPKKRGVKMGSQQPMDVLSFILCLPWLAGRYNNPMMELTLSSSQGSMNSATDTRVSI
jgi:hypothetical protein